MALSLIHDTISTEMLEFNQIFETVLEDGGHLVVKEQTKESDDPMLLELIGWVMVLAAIVHVAYWLTFPVSVWIMVYLLVSGTCNNLWSLLVPVMCSMP